MWIDFFSRCIVNVDRLFVACVQSIFVCLFVLMFFLFKVVPSFVKMFFCVYNFNIFYQLTLTVSANCRDIQYCFHFEKRLSSCTFPRTDLRSMFNKIVWPPPSQLQPSVLYCVMKHMYFYLFIARNLFRWMSISNNLLLEYIFRLYWLQHQLQACSWLLSPE